MGKSQSSISEEALAEKKANLLGESYGEEPLLAGHRSKGRRKSRHFYTPKVERKMRELDCIFS